MHSVTVGIVLNFGNAFNFLVLAKLCNLFDKTALVYAVGKLAYNNLKAVVFAFNNLGSCTNINLASACCICFLYSTLAHNNSGSREVGTLDMLHKLVKLNICVIDKRTNAVCNLFKIMSRNIRRHTYCDTGRAVDKQVREFCRQNLRLGLRIVKVRKPVNGILADILKHFHRDFAHSRLCITVSGGRVAVDGAEVTVTVYKRMTK